MSDGSTSQRTLPFANLFTNTPTTIAADATAALAMEGNYCMVSLYDGDDPGIEVGGNANVTLGCGMIANSRSETAVTTDGSSKVTASPIGAVGGLDGEPGHFIGPSSVSKRSLWILFIRAAGGCARRRNARRRPVSRPSLPSRAR